MVNKDSFVYQPPQGPLEICYQDKDVVGVLKPSGLLSVPGRGEDKEDSLYTRIKELFPLAQMVHRLDMDTSGIVLVALRRKAERNLKEQFRQRGVHKTYQAIVYGQCTESSFDIDAPLGPHPIETLRHQIVKDGKPSLTKVEVLFSNSNISLLKVVPRTGRSHQIRVHLESVGLPILGDRFYAPASVVELAPRLMLHAHQIEFDHPYSGQRIQVTSPSDLRQEYEILLAQ